jgi:hypothetical protein
MAKISLQTGDSFITISGPSTIIPSSSKITGNFKIILGTSTATADLSKIGKAAASTVVEIHKPSTDYHEVVHKGYVYILAGTSTDLKTAVVKLPIAKKADSTAVKLHFSDYKTSVAVTKEGNLEHAPDGTTAVTLAASATSIDEGQSVTYTATLASPAPVGGVSVPYTLSGISAEDFGLTSLTGSIKILAGQTTGTVVLNAVADATTESTETLSIALQAAPRVELGTTTTASTTIVDTSKTPVVLPTVTLTSSAATVDETAPNNTVTYTATLNSPATSALSIPYTLGGTATATTDYTVNAGTINIAAGATTGTLVLNVANDGITEGNETVTVTLNNNVAGAIVNTTALMTTINDTSLSILLPVGTTAANTVTNVTATTATESFSLNIAASKVSSSNTQNLITGFDVANDKLSLSGTGINPGTYTLASKLTGIGVTYDPFSDQTVVNFGLDGNGDLISLGLVGIVTASSVNVTIVS